MKNQRHSVYGNFINPKFLIKKITEVNFGYYQILILTMNYCINIALKIKPIISVIKTKQN